MPLDRVLIMNIINWLKSRTNKEKEMAEIKDVVTDDLVKTALKSVAVTAAVKAQIKSELDTQIDAAVDTALTDLLGESADEPK